MTEAAPGVTSLAPPRSRDKGETVGLPRFFTDARVVRGDGAPVDVGEVGEIQVAGPNVISSYWNRPEADEDAFADAGSTPATWVWSIRRAFSRSSIGSRT